MDLDASGRKWYLARHNISGCRDNLFQWLLLLSVEPWTPLEIRSTRRSDSRVSYRKRVCEVFPGYFFLNADLSVQPASIIKKHSAFVEFVHFGNGLAHIASSIVEQLRDIYPDIISDADSVNQDAPPSALTDAQYNFLLRLNESSHTASRIGLLFEMIRHSSHI